MFKAVTRGSGAGVIATIVMTGVMYLGKWAGLLRQLPPQQITAKADRFSGGGLSAAMPGGFNVRWMGAHAAYGIASAMPYLALRRSVPGPSVVLGTVYGIALWAVSYFKILPSLGLFPSPSADSRSRSTVMVVAHVVYGGVLSRLATSGR